MEPIATRTGFFTCAPIRLATEDSIVAEKHIVCRSAGSSPTADWDITTGDGSVTLVVPDGFGAELDAHTGDGGIHMQDVTLSNVTGTIGRNSLRGRLGAGGHNVRVRTGDGSITLKRS